ncbi:hypothetical protein J2799_001663 [Chryseobacterium vietnamense]|jgi:hypothetical protein|uniref:conjugal transfer protein MobB n=1 Tax=Chryseobacterium vietnamense TaxID=866785 RepID=UPI002860221B|nr:conjugal transfer protein MobB [Chryseobacterium vietnamense]MDR6487178.1 hypothetical protein [Chryseobacterium vietnamense]
MIAKINKRSSLYGALTYNQLKVQNKNAKILLLHNMIETPDGQYTVGQLASSFECYLIANRKTEKHTLHISLNPDPNDRVDDDQFIEIAEYYMKAMGYGEQPFVVFKHTDIARIHIHIVSVCVDQEGRKISNIIDWQCSMNVCREMEHKFGLLPVVRKDRGTKNKIFNPVDYKSGDIQNQIDSIISNLPNYYDFQTIPDYKALLSLFNVGFKNIGVGIDEKKNKLMYYPLDKTGKRAGNSFRDSLFGKEAGLHSLKQHCKKGIDALKASPIKHRLCHLVNNIMLSTDNEKDFKNNLVQQGVNLVFCKNILGEICDMIFVDHYSRSVWNHLALEIELPENIFCNKWENNMLSHHKPYIEKNKKKSLLNDNDGYFSEKLHSLFDFLNKGNDHSIEELHVSSKIILSQDSSDDIGIKSDSWLKNRKKRNLQ